jgi:hypothetical protein
MAQSSKTKLLDLNSAVFWNKKYKLYIENGNTIFGYIFFKLKPEENV